jgi:septal ring factor EnvC (AmiA/AmiB activator)
MTWGHVSDMQKRYRANRELKTSQKRRKNSEKRLDPYGKAERQPEKKYTRKEIEAAKDHFASKRKKNQRLKAVLTAIGLALIVWLVFWIAS